MKFFTLLITLIVALPAIANVKVKVDPPNPVKGESFKVTFEVTTDTDAEPNVAFYPIGLEVLGRSREVSISSSYINGKFKSQKKINFHYEMISDVSRVAKIKNIEVTVGDKVLRHPEVAIKVLLKKKTPASVFVRAELSKEDVYVGEGVDLRYYLYTRVPVVQVEFKNFPKLNGFIKRFHKTVDDEQTVEEDGIIYKKILKYSGRIYPEKEGKLIIDPLHLNIQYATSRGSPFGNFGLSFNRFRSKTVISKKVEVNVSALPTENVPDNFTGLIGEHKFTFTSPKGKYVVNEAIEAKLEVLGPGALEKMEAPKVYQSNALENFDTKSEFFEVGKDMGRKIFDYTYLARGNTEIEDRKLALSYFDPNEKTYKEIEINIPGLVVGGGGTSVGRQNNTGSLEKTNPKVLRENPALVLDSPLAPLFTTDWKGLPLNWPKWVLIGVFIVIILQLLELIWSKILSRPTVSTYDSLIKEMKKNGLEYSKVVKLIYELPEANENTSIRDIVKKSRLPNRDKDYFLELLDALEGGDFSEVKRTDKKVRFKSASFKSLQRELSNASH